MLKVVTVSGPSCVGKGPIEKALEEFFCLRLGKVPIIKAKESRPNPRPDEIDKWNDKRYFMYADEIRGLGKGYVKCECREFPQAASLDEIAKAARSNEHDAIYIEAYHTLAPQIAAHFEKATSVFISPVSKNDIESFHDFRSYLTSLMMHRLAVRSAYSGEDFNSDRVVLDNMSRAIGAYDEIKSAHKFDYVIVNKFAEGHPNWRMDHAGKFYHVPDLCVFKSVNAVADIIRGREPKYYERWNKTTAR
jgi:guanylate kinase